MDDLTDAGHLPDDGPRKQAGAVFGFEEFWPTAYRQYKPQLGAIADLIRLGDEMLKAGEESAAEPLRKVICALTRATMTGASEAVILCGNGCGAGAMKIARGMYESRWTAEYLRRNPLEVEDYLEFWKVLSWRRLHWLQESSPSEASRVPEDVVKQVEDDYIQAKARFTDGKGRVRFQWSEKPVREMAKGIGREKEYELPYAIACSIHHGNFEGLSALFSSWGEAVVPDPPPSTAWMRQALVLAHTNLWFALNTLNDSCGLDFSHKLDTAQQAHANVWKG
jgi:Family of unknown function (DUF5677)